MMSILQTLRIQSSSLCGESMNHKKGLHSDRFYPDIIQEKEY